MTAPEPDSFPQSPLLTRALSAYWCSAHAGHTINADTRMAAVFLLLADELESWAPPGVLGRLSRNVLCEAADRLRASIPNSILPPPQ